MRTTIRMALRWRANGGPTLYVLAGMRYEIMIVYTSSTVWIVTHTLIYACIFMPENDLDRMTDMKKENDAKFILHSIHICNLENGSSRNRSENL